MQLLLALLLQTVVAVVACRLRLFSLPDHTQFTKTHTRSVLLLIVLVERVPITAQTWRTEKQRLRESERARLNRRTVVSSLFTPVLAKVDEIASR